MMMRSAHKRDEERARYARGQLLPLIDIFHAATPFITPPRYDDATLVDMPDDADAAVDADDDIDGHTALASAADDAICL